DHDRIDARPAVHGLVATLPLSRPRLSGPRARRSRGGAAAVADNTVPAGGGVGLRPFVAAAAGPALRRPAFRAAAAALAGPAGDTAWSEGDRRDHARRQL